MKLLGLTVMVLDEIDEYLFSEPVDRRREVAEIMREPKHRPLLGRRSRKVIDIKRKPK